LNGIDRKIETSTGQSVHDYIYGMIDINHVNGKTFKDYRLDEFMASGDIDVLHFSRSYEGENLLDEINLHELRQFTREDLISHGFELVFRVKG
jgi:hypothetical protein